MNGTQTGDSHLAEIIFRVQGIILSCSLPPFPASNKLKDCKSLRQYITLTGYGSPTFNANVDIMKELTGLFQPHFSDESLEEWNAWTEPNSSGKVDLDTFGLLTKYAGTQFVHTTDNQVKYRKRTVKDKKPTYKEISPRLIKPGHLVEAMFSFVAWPIRGKRQKIINIMRGITLLDESTQQLSSALTTGRPSNGLIRYRIDEEDKVEQNKRQKKGDELALGTNEIEESNRVMDEMDKTVRSEERQ
ncbi:hypothetical protein K435DRAFT_851909 [Dendrothele bispora CBS 962.96]|uniref:Uncharacterized protein n=1 Tax=Dendrothele bispora (strain CBS 962.96) TaxID=1314807 RepID=A0A4S8MLC8_DENBC|nr:hypothetical protein K435DRAFT_851909 [Dendrothele bispora CBS 962.96]